MKLKIHDLDNETAEVFTESSIPQAHQWAFDHIMDQDCVSISCGTTVYEVCE